MIRRGILILALSAVGCTTPNAANIQLRKDNQALRDQVSSLQRQHAADAADIQSLQSHATTVPVLPQGRLESLFTVHGLKLGRLTGGADLDPAKAGDDGLKVYITPTDDAGDQIKAAGSFTVEAYDLNEKDHPLVGTWSFPLQQASKNWYGQALLYCYVLTCPWQHGPPAHPDLTLKITFTDALTQRQFTIQKVVKVNLPPRVK
jgi:hypothetical protein